MIAMCPGTLLADPMNATDDEVRAAAEAALDAGFTEGSVWQHQIPLLAESGLKISVVEAAMAWANGDAQTAAAEARQLAELVKQTGADKVLAACLDASISDMPQAKRNFAALAETVGAVGAQVCLEFLPWSAVADLATAWEIVEPVPGAALLLDTWHWVRQPGGPAFELLAEIPGDRIAYVQVCDAAATPGDDLLAEAMTNRLLPGDGIVDFAAFFAALDAIGAHPYIATEIFNPDLVRSRGAVGAANAMRAAAERVVPQS